MTRATLAGKVELHRGQSYKSALLDEPGPYLLGLGTIARNGGFSGGSLRTYGGESPDRILLRPGDLYLSLKDVTHKAELLGAVARVPADVPLGRLTQDTVRLQITSPQVDADYLYWLLRAPDYRAYCRMHGTGTTTLDLSRADFLGYQFDLPPLAEQQAIAEVLGALDDKIAANTALAATADALIRAEYASLSGQRVRVSEVASSPRSGVDPSLVAPHDLYVGLEHIGRRNMWLTDGGEAAEVTSTKSRFEAGDVLFGKLRPYFHKVVSAPGSGICSTDILVVRSKEPQLASVLLAALTSDAVIDHVVSASGGTRMPRTSWKDLAAVEIWWPDAIEVERFTDRLDAVRESTVAVIAENRTLAAMRDALLPQLMSGKLRVRDAEALIVQSGV